MQTWGRYTVFSCIERTHLVEVYDAYLPISADLVRRVHIRRPAKADDSARALVQHARRAVQLSSGHIAPILELTYAADVPMVVCAALPGRTLATLRAESQGLQVGLDIHAILAIGIGLLAGVGQAHQHTDPTGQLVGLVHRDLRPETVWVGFDGTIQVDGFGYAVDSSAPAGPPPPNIFPLYWAPELINGDTIDHRSDVFSVGAILLQLLTGQSAWPGRTTQDQVRSAQLGQVNLLSRAAPQVAIELQQIVDSALSVDPNNRPPSAAVFRDELARLLYRSEPAYSTERLSSAVAMVLGEAATEDRTRSAAAYDHLGHLEPGLVVEPRSSPDASLLDAAEPTPPPPPQPTPEIEPLPVPTAIPAPRAHPAPDTDPTSMAPDWSAASGASGGFESLEGAGSSRPPVPLAGSVPPSSTPPPIEAPDPAAAMASAFASEQSMGVPAQSSSSRPSRRPSVAMMAIIGLVVVATIGWMLSPERIQRRAGRLVRLAVIGRKPGGTLILETLPAGAHVTLDDEDTGQKTPMTMENLESEVTHTLVLRLDENVVRTTTISILANRKRTLRVVFPEAVARVRVKTEPPEANVFVDDRAVALSPASLTLRAGRVTQVRVEKTGYVPFTWRVEPQAGDNDTLEQTLEKTEELKAAEAEEAAALEAAEPRQRRRRRRARRQ